MFEEHRMPGGNGFHPAPPEERRTHPRYHFTAAVEALDHNHRTRMNARTSDIGRGGCYVDTYCPFPLKTGVKLRLTNEKSSFVAEATVVYSQIGMGMGLEFTAIEPPADQRSGQMDWRAERLRADAVCGPRRTP